MGENRGWGGHKFVPIAAIYLENLEFCYFLFQTRKMHGICTKSGKNLEKNLKFANSIFTFQDIIYKNDSDLLLCHIYIINTNTDSKTN